MEVLQQHVSRMILEWQVLIVTCKLTPRLQQHILSTIKIYEEIASQQNLDVAKSGRTLFSLKDAVDNHWKQIYGELSQTAKMFRHMLIFQMFLRSKLLEDYVGTPYVVNENIVCLRRSTSTLEDRQRAAYEFGTHLDGLDDIYQQRVVIVLEELMLDRAHVETKTDTALARGGQPNSDIQPLIDRFDWASLAGVVWNDRLLALDLDFEEDRTRTAILHSISQIRKKYFDELNSPSMFVISKHASSLCVKAAPPRYSELDVGHESICQGEEDKSRVKTFKTGSWKFVKNILSKTSVFSSSKSS